MGEEVPSAGPAGQAAPLSHSQCVPLRAMPFAYFDRLSAPRKAVYLRSDAIERVALPAGAPLTPIVQQIEEELQAERRKEVEAAARALVSELVRRLKVPPVRVKVLTVRPSGNWGELHGLYEPEEDGASALITV